MHPFSKIPTVTIASTDADTVPMFQPGQDVGNPGFITLKSHTVTSNPVIHPFYMVVKLPDYLPVKNMELGQTAVFSSCLPAMYEECFTIPEIGYVVVKAKAN